MMNLNSTPIRVISINYVSVFLPRRWKPCNPTSSLRLMTLPVIIITSIVAMITMNSVSESLTDTSITMVWKVTHCRLKILTNRCIRAREACRMWRTSIRITRLTNMSGISNIRYRFALKILRWVRIILPISRCRLYVLAMERTRKSNGISLRYL